MKHKDRSGSFGSPKRIMIKLSGEGLGGEAGSAIHLKTLETLTDQLVILSQTWEIALVVGGGNFFRGGSSLGEAFPRAVGDQVGMLATLMNGLLIQALLIQKGISVQLFSGQVVEGVTQPFLQAQTENYFGQGRICIFAGGIGHPYFTTDTAAVVWALRSGCQLLLKGTKVDGVYSADPLSDAQAQFFPHLSYAQVLEKKLRVMDLTALTLSQENKLPLVIFNVSRPESLLNILGNKPPFTRID